MATITTYGSHLLALSIESIRWGLGTSTLRSRAEKRTEIGRHSNWIDFIFPFEMQKNHLTRKRTTREKLLIPPGLVLGQAGEGISTFSRNEKELRISGKRIRLQAITKGLG